MNLREFLEITYGQPATDPVAELRRTIAAINNDNSLAGFVIETRGGSFDITLPKIKLDKPKCLSTPEKWEATYAYITKAETELGGGLQCDFLD